MLPRGQVLHVTKRMRRCRWTPLKGFSCARKVRYCTSQHTWHSSGRAEHDMQGQIVLKLLNTYNPLQILNQGKAPFFTGKGLFLQGTATRLCVWHSKQALAAPGAHVDRLIVQGPKVHHVLVAFLCQQIWCNLQPASASAMSQAECIQLQHHTVSAID